MNHTKILDSGNVQLVLSAEDAQYLTSLLGNHVLGSGHSRIVNSRIFGQLSALGFVGETLDTLNGNNTIRLTTQGE